MGGWVGGVEHGAENESQRQIVFEQRNGRLLDGLCGIVLFYHFLKKKSSNVKLFLIVGGVAIGMLRGNPVLSAI